MARRRSRPSSPAQPGVEPTRVARHLPARTVALLVAAILSVHYAIAVLSLRRENPTIDEVNHLPAGITYWKTGSFKLYHHNPPLVKQIAALPVLGAKVDPLLRGRLWEGESPSPADFGRAFAGLNAMNYLELFTVSRTVMPLFSILGGLVVFAWSRRLWGDLGGLLSLALWCSCPNILAHSRLVTSDAAAASIGVGATYLFWRYLKTPTWRFTALAGVALGVAQLTKFSLLLLYGIWPVLWFVHEVARRDVRPDARRWLRSVLHGVAMVAASVIVIDIGYGFEGVGRPLGSFDFASRSFLTRPGQTLRHSTNGLFEISWKHRVNRVRGTWLGSVPSPLPAHYLLGFDEQKIETDALPLVWFDPRVSDPNAVTGYPVYLDGVLRRHGWREYFLKALLYKVPEGTLWLAGLSLVVLAVSRRSRATFIDEFTLLFTPLAFLGAMTFLTDINLGLRYILPMFPYVFIGIGRLVRWSGDCVGAARQVARAAIFAPLAGTLLSVALIHPSYLAYFNAASGGPDRDPPHLIDSNLDWGQDLVGLRRWLRTQNETSPIGLAYFGQITPNLFAERGDPFPWFLPPARAGTMGPMRRDTSSLTGPASRITPGLYAVSATLLQGLPWRVYDPSLRVWAGTWKAEEHAFSYFRGLTPIERIGHSILIYRLSPADAERLNARLGLP